MTRYIFILILISLIALWPFFKKGYFESHDGEWMVIRFTAFHQALTSGQFPVRYVERLNNNYGYPVFNFLYPLPFYLAEIPKVLGVGFVDSVKIIFVLSTFASVIAMFWALSSIFSKTAAAAGAILYLFIPYRFVDLYVRGSLGENLAFVFAPLVALCLFKLSKGHRTFAPILAASVALLILSHNVIAILFIPFFFILAFLLIKKNRRIVISSFIFGFLISAFFWIPALYDLQYVRLSQIKVSEIANHLVDFSKLIVPTWGYGPNPNGADGLSVQIGLVAIFIIASTLISLGKLKNGRQVIFYFLIVFALVAVANLKIAAAFWQTIPAVDVIQFPWRMHSVLVFIAAFLAASTIELAGRKTLLASLVIAASVISTILYTKPQAFVDRGDDYYATNEDTTNVRDEYLPLWVRQKPAGRADEKITLLGSGSIISQKIHPANYQAEIITDSPSLIQVNTIYFPGWQARVNGQTVPINYSNDSGLITFELPQGISSVIISYSRTSVHLLSEIISIAGLMATGYWIYKKWLNPNS